MYQHESQKHIIKCEKQLGTRLGVFPFACKTYTKKVPILFSLSTITLFIKVIIIGL